MDTLFLIFIQPLQVLMAAVLEYAYGISHNYIIAIIILSIVVNFILLPLYHFAEKLQNKERAVQARLRPKTDEINAVFQGAERFMMIHTLYRQAQYHPIYAIRTSLGFLIQVPFFLAAYLLLLHYEPFIGIAGFWFSDLSQADQLVFGINIMPIIMTIVNLASGFIYTRNLTKNEKIQIWVISILFLVLLYQSPVALVLYWTLNNIFSLFKNIVYHQFSNPVVQQTHREIDIFRKIGRVLRRNISFQNFQQIRKNVFNAMVFRTALFLFILDRFIFINFFQAQAGSFLTIINLGIGFICLLLIIISIKKLFINWQHFLTFLNDRFLALKNNVIWQWGYSLVWLTLFLVFLTHANKYFAQSKLFDKTHPDVSSAITISILILFTLCGLALKSFLQQFNKKEKQTVITAVIILVLVPILLILIFLWLTNSYAITEPIYTKEALAGVLCVFLMVTYFTVIRRFLNIMARLRNHLIINYFTNHPFFKAILIVVLFFNLYFSAAHSS